ncbi:acyl-CoA dehydrogenase family protein [Nocardioides panzhihuensis]|uniref:Acyl-[acyl-carrier-protein] dehydrogenase MbtN n=1 Tax=Nocardioides panzhihuensis TaxID=860243 RepID=A0A7Z0DNG3_9ACTN|nr:acyl-CoA dehydrogenase family protein [Nocardioides panzhihuensis]NYI78850.1 acyl-CoA dehydrogenase [Nocardioides panzhihuensis]
MQRTIFGEDHEAFRGTVRQFFEKQVAPGFSAWERAGHPPRDFYRQAAELGIVGIQVPEEYGGAGVASYKFNAIVTEESVRSDINLGPLRVHMDLVLPYLLSYATEEQKQRWLPGFAAGELMTAIAMTEPGTGSDLAGIRTTARLDGDCYVLNGAKTFITGGYNADRVLVVARTSAPDPTNRRTGLSILVVDTKSPGYEVGRMLDKLGLKAQDTCELSFDDVRVPFEDLLGEEGQAFAYLSNNLPQERLTIAVGAWSAAAHAVDLARDYTGERQVFGKAVAEFQNTKFVLAECAVDVAAGQAFLDQALEAHDRGELSGPDAAAVKLWMTEMQARVVDKCLQLHGGYGYMNEYPIARLYADARVSRIYGGTSEVMKTIVAKSLGL